MKPLYHYYSVNIIIQHLVQTLSRLHVVYPCSGRRNMVYRWEEDRSYYICKYDEGRRNGKSDSGIDMSFKYHVTMSSGNNF